MVVAVTRARKKIRMSERARGQRNRAVFAFVIVTIVT